MIDIYRAKRIIDKLSSILKDELKEDYEKYNKKLGIGLQKIFNALRGA